MAQPEADEEDQQIDDVQAAIEEHQQRKHPRKKRLSGGSRHHRKNNPSLEDVVLAELDEDTGFDLSERSFASEKQRFNSKTGKVTQEATVEDDTVVQPPLEDHPIIVNTAGSCLDNSSFPLDRQLKPVAEINTFNKKTVKRQLRKDKTDRYFDYFETHKQVIGPPQQPQPIRTQTNSDTGFLGTKANTIEMEIPSLVECQSFLHNKEAERHRAKQTNIPHKGHNVVYDFLAAFYVYFANSLQPELMLVLLNAVGATVYFCQNHERFAAKLDFSFLAFSVVFPLTFLIQSTFSRRDVALQRICDFKSSLLSAALLTLTVDWPISSKEEEVGGRLALPDNFAAGVATDFRDIVQLVYEYLSMPSVAHGRNIVFAKKRLATMRVHALQNDICKRFNDAMFDLYMRTNVMKEYGFPSGEASRLHQYHQYIQQRFELLRVLKYYRTPQATRSFGRVYIYVLPWLTGPYFAWVFESTEENYPFTLALAAFTFLVLLGLLNTQQGLEDPFLAEYTSWTPGIDTVKLEFEFASVLQAIDQYYAQAELNRLWKLQPQNTGEDNSFEQSQNLEMRLQPRVLKHESSISA